MADRAKARRAAAKIEKALELYRQGVELLQEAVPRDHTNHEPYQYHIHRATDEITYALGFARLNAR